MYLGDMGGWGEEVVGEVLGVRVGGGGLDDFWKVGRFLRWSGLGVWVGWLVYA